MREPSANRRPSRPGGPSARRNARLRASATLLFVWSLASAQEGPDAPVGGEFQVNSYTTADQGEPSVSANAQGDFVVAWESYGQDGSVLGVSAQKFDAQGSPIGTELQVNSYTTGWQVQPAVALDSQGRFVVAWSSWDDVTSSTADIRAQRFDSNGQPTGDEIRVNSSTSGRQTRPALAMDGAGNFIVTWHGVPDGGSSQVISGRRFDSSGNRLANEFVVSSQTTGNQSYSSVAVNTNGDFVVVWHGQNGSGPGYSVFGRRFAAEGQALGDDFRVNENTTSSHFSPSLSVEEDGTFVVAWTTQASSRDVLARMFGNDGAPTTGEFLVNSYTSFTQGEPSIASDAQGSFVVSWNGEDPNYGGYGIFGQRYDADGRALGGEFQIDSLTVGTQIRPSIAMDSRGDFVVAWASRYPGNEVFAQRYETSRVGDRVFVDADLDGIQDPHENGEEGVAVHLFDSQATLLRSTTTDAMGDYLFTVVPAGDHFLQFELPDEWAFAARDRGADDSIDSDADRITGETDTFEVLAGQNSDGWDAGLARGLGDRVWLDDGDGIKELGEPGVAGVTIHLLEDFVPVQTTVTDAEGRYAFDVDPTGQRLELVEPPGFGLTTPDAGPSDLLDSDFDALFGRTTVILGTGSRVQPYWDAGLVEISMLSDLVWNDLNEDGIQQPDEPGLEGFQVRLLAAGGSLVATTRSDELGHWSFTGLEDGSYRVEVHGPPGWVPTLPHQGEDPALDSDIDAGGRSPWVQLAQQLERTIDVGFVFREGLFGDGFESGTTSSWSGTNP